MKNYRIILACFVILTFTGCDSLITDKPESMLIQDNFFTTQAHISEGVIGCYKGMCKTVNEEWKFTEMRSDNSCVAYTSTSSGDRSDYCFMKFFNTPTSLPILRDYWYVLFQNISNVNAILPSVAGGSTYVSSESLRAQYEGELLFIRAYHYYTLVNLWGDMFKVTKVIGPLDAKKIVRSPVAEIYDEIIFPDLIKAADQLPASYSANETGRITQWAAKAMLAKAYLQKGEIADIAKAKILLEEVIAATQYCNLVTTKGSATSAYANVFSVDNEMNPEIIFAVRYNRTNSLGSSFWGTFAPDGSAAQIIKAGTPVGDNNPAPEFMSKFTDPSDTRKDVNFKVWYKNASTPEYYVSKYTDPNMVLALQGENDWPVIRYADVLLLHAEILAQSSNPDDARAEVNRIRLRAGVKPYIHFDSKIEALDSVYQERRIELAFENHRWFDLLRMGKAYDDPNKALTILKTAIFTTDWLNLYALFNKIAPPVESSFIIERLFLPIPQQEIDTNNELVIPQNPGY
jgi:hypothetical protein